MLNIGVVDVHKNGTLYLKMNLFAVKFYTIYLI